jgi:hypothetical protein
MVAGWVRLPPVLQCHMADYTKPIQMRKIEFIHPALKDAETGDQITLYLPAYKVVCDRCEGEGNHFRTDLDEMELIRDMKWEQDWDGLEMYENGHFNQVCEVCKGERVVDQLNWSYFKAEFPEEHLKVIQYNNWIKEDEENRAWERRMGA